MGGNVCCVFLNSFPFYAKGEKGVRPMAAKLSRLLPWAYAQLLMTKFGKDINGLTLELNGLKS